MYSYKFANATDERPYETRTNGDTSGGFVTFGVDVVDWSKQKRVNGVLKDIPVIPPPEPPQPTAAEIKTQKLQDLDWQYQPQFAELVNALGVATLSDSTDLIASIKADYADLKAEYDTKRGEIDG
jgi:hypothetical protein